MGLALRLAKKGLGRTSPNPVVGAVVVKNGRVIGSGYHRKAGLEHAEIKALIEAGKNARGSTVYVTLEPCSHFGRTPPCTETIIKSGVKRVVSAMKDPNRLNNGKGFEKLRRAGIKVLGGVLEDEARNLNEIFIKYITTKRPFVIAKVAQSIDGKIATKTGRSKWISGEESRRYVHKLRGRVDAVMVGLRAVLKDNPLLTSRSGGVNGRQPVKIIVDSKLRTPLKSRIFSRDKTGRVIIATTTKAPEKRIGKFEKMGAEVLVLAEKNGLVDLKELLGELGKREITSVLVEGGGELIGSLVDEKLIDKFLFFIAPKIIGGRSAVTSVEGEGFSSVEEALVLNNLTYKRIGKDFLIEGYLNAQRTTHNA